MLVPHFSHLIGLFRKGVMFAGAPPILDGVNLA